MEIVPNLHFNGNGVEAIALYEQAFEAKTTVFLQYKDADPLDMDQGMNDDIQEYIYHAEIMIRKQRMMLNDHIDDVACGINVSLLVSFDNLENLKKAFEVLKHGAKILVPMTETTYSEGFVSLIDRHGVRWELIKEY